MSPPVRPRGAIGLVSLATVVALAALLFAASASPASAAPADAPADTQPPSSTPSPPPTAQPLSMDSLPTALVTSFPLTVSGSGTPGDVVAVSAGSTPGADESCPATVGDDGRWSCALASLPDGPGVAVRAESRSTGQSTGDRVDVLHPPTISGDGVVSTSGAVRGTAFPGARVTVTAETGASCTFPADSSGSWGCVLNGSLPDGRHTVTATQVADFSSQRSGRSAAVPLAVDRTPPGAPTISTPTAGTSAPAGSPIAFGGAGESGARVTLYAQTADGTTVICSATVVGGAWSCAGALAGGAYTVSALQRDAAGNVSAGSNAVALSVAAAAGAAAGPTPSPTRTPVPTPAPAVPAPESPGAAPPSGPTRPDTRGWFDAPFTTASAPVVSAAALPGWMRSAGLAVAALLLLVLPARLLAAAIARGREGHGRGRSSLFGRNRPRSDAADASALFGGATVRPIAAGPHSAGPGGAGANAADAEPATDTPAQRVWSLAATGAATALLVTLSTPVPDAGTYPLVLLAVAVAVAAVNAVWVLAGRTLAVHSRLPAPRLVLRPGLLVVVAVAAIGSRLLGLSPALLFVLVVGIALEPHAGRVRRGRIAAVQVSAVAALGVLAWLAVGLLGVPSDPASAFLTEFVNVLALTGIGSAAVILLPIGGLAGRAVAQWSRLLWAALSLLVYTLLFALLLPVASLVERGVGILVVVAVAVGFAATSLAVWLWERFVAPALDRSLP